MTDDMEAVQSAAERVGFSGAVRVQRQGDTVCEFALGMADRANGRPNDLDTRFAVASITKGVTALTIMSLVESGDLGLDTSVVSIVDELSTIVDPSVTIDHLLSHRSGVGDYIDEDVVGDIDDYVLGARSAHTLQGPLDYLDLLQAYPQRTSPGTAFAYNNGGYVMLSLVIEKLTGSFHSAVEQRVLHLAGMRGGGFFRSDQLPASTALGYLQDGRTNIFHLPVIGGGDGGMFMTLDDAMAFWEAVFGERIVSSSSVELMTTPESVRPDRPSYGRGFWLDEKADHVWVEGMDAGVSGQTGVIRSRGVSYAVLANDSSTAWPVVRAIIE